jgi:hypothetical protein
VSDFGLPVVKHQTDSKGSYSWEKLIKNLDEDLNKLKFRELSVNRENTYRDLELAEKIFKDILPVRIRGKHWWTVGITIYVIHYVGLEEFMLFMYDDPEGGKRLMSWFSKENMHFIQWFEDQNLLSDSNTNVYTGSGDLLTQMNFLSERGEIRSIYQICGDWQNHRRLSGYLQICLVNSSFFISYP